MCSEWPLIPLRDFVDLLAGFAFKSTGYSDGQDDVRLLRGDNIAPGRVRWDGVKRWSRENAVGLERYALEPGDVVLAMDRPWIPAGLKVAQVQATDTPSYLVQRVARIRPASREDCSFLFALLSTPEFESYIQNVTTGTAVPHISAKQILDFEFRLPPAYVRAKVGEIVAALNERITLLRETNTTLEAMAQALFKSWFVDFDPVHARARGEQPAGLTPEVAALFPDSFEESDLGQVPKGWSTGSLNDLALLNPESWTVKNRPDSVAYVDLANAKENEIAEITEFLFEDAPSRARRVLRDGDTIVGTVRPGNRSYAFISNPRPNLTGSTGFAVLRPKQKAATEYVYLAATANSSIEYLAHVADGGAYPAVRPEVVSNLPCVLPSYDVLNAFHAVAAPLFAKVAANHQQAQTLANLRDTLLPRLISGQLRLPDAEEQLSEAGLCQ
ncbi:restriction endonuclease subunit S [Aeromonas sp. QDB11]|uniref:restriction endonuclease subunit S n=1 Tax=Aeromonas sp. QDB11 TaxID=2990482 RepID=UPI0022E10735|nr:restriction endonuclease subunit S [Aeromonas sp. QDB11]